MSRDSTVSRVVAETNRTRWRKYDMVFFRSLALASVMLSSTAALAAVWPGVAPCAATLQACIDGVPAGDTVRIATDDPVLEDLSITKSLTLTREVGFEPTISGEILLSSGMSSATSTNGTGSISITISGLAIQGPVRAIARAVDLDVHVLGNTITSDVDNRFAVELSSDIALSDAGDLTAEVRENDIRVMGSALSDTCGGVAVSATTSPQVFAAIVHNTLFVSSCRQGSGIFAGTGPGRTTAVDVLRNRMVVPDTNFGIALQNFADGPSSTLDGRIVGNLVQGEFFGVGLSVINAAGGTLAAQLTNNTIVDHDAGVLLSANPGDPVSGEVANNIVASNNTEGLRIGAAGITNRHNLVFSNGMENFIPGPGTLFTDPQFVGGSSFHLEPGSPAIDAGANDAVPGDVTLDLDGAPRIQGGTVDIGAFEELGGAPDPLVAVPSLSSLGLALLALALAGVATGLLRRGR